MDIYFILCGESKRKSRSKKLIKLLNNEKLIFLKENNTLEKFWNDKTILISGLSGFNPNLPRKYSVAEEVRTFLVHQGIPNKVIIKEEESLDTLGNMIFSFPIINNIVNKYKKINLVLITEGFHMKRSKELFLKIFQNLINKINIEFVSSRTKGIPWNIYKIRLLKEIKLLFQAKLHNKYWNALIKRTAQLSTNYSRDFLIYEIINIDSKIFKLKNYEDYSNYLFSMPFYNTIYKARKEIDISKSLYAKLIEAHTKFK